MIESQLGQCKIPEMIGAAGMGEVYQTEEIQLGPHVAIEVLPEQFTNDPERVARPTALIAGAASVRSQAPFFRHP